MLVEGEDCGEENSHTGHPHDQEGDDTVGNIVFKSMWHHPIDVDGKDSFGDVVWGEEGDLFPRLWGLII